MRGMTLTSLLVLLGAFTVSACTTPGNAGATAGQASAAADAEGLVRVKVKGVQEVYARPNANLSTYNKVLLDPIDVSFSKNWDPQPGGQSISAEERQQIRDGLARILREELAQELARTGRYSLVESAGDDVLRIQADIRDLIINAPDVPRAGITRSYTLSAGEMTLVADLRDAPTGALIARVIDRRRDPESTLFDLTSRLDNVAAARQAASRWARILIEQLDTAHRIGGAS